MPTAIRCTSRPADERGPHRRADRGAQSISTSSGSWPPRATPAPRRFIRATASSPRTPASPSAARRDGIAFVGPTPEQMRAFGLKHTARRAGRRERRAAAAGHAGCSTTAEDALAAARAIGYPVMLKSTAGGGGIGMQLCRDEQALREAFEPVRRLARNNFADDGVFLEKFVERARHIEVQIFGDGRGDVLALGERDCSLQRRNQKVVEETPAPDLPTSVRDAMLATAVRLGPRGQLPLGGHGRVPLRRGPRGVLLPRGQHAAAGRARRHRGSDWASISSSGCCAWPRASRSIRRRYACSRADTRSRCASTPRIRAGNFEPCAGVLTEVRFPDDARVETWVERGSEVSPYYDPMLAKLIVHGDDRERRARAAGSCARRHAARGLETNLDYLRQIAADPVFAAGRQTTAYLATVDYRVARDRRARGRHADDACRISPGASATGTSACRRRGRWTSCRFRLGNRLLGNPRIRRRPRAHGDRPDAALPQRRRRRAHGRADARRARRRGR